MFVVPGMPKGSPAVMTVVSPFSRAPISTALSTHLSKSSNVSNSSPTSIGITPHTRLSLRQRFSVVAQAII